ncbi:hypothetical protein ABHV46_05670 [Asaia sp. BMEF1]|uniref:STM4504/CBY_0614 family protein n=1 Tax=Asaia sp. BMEF1 TaxID=3155932 RepID=UPI003F67D3F5
MANIDTYSKREKISIGIASDVYVYDKVPEILKTQLLYLIEDLLGNSTSSYVETPQSLSGNGRWNNLLSDIARELGFLHKKSRDPRTDLHKVLTHVNLGLNRFLDICDIFLHRKVVPSHNYPKDEKREEVIEELNTRFREAGFGYQYDGNKIIRMDNLLIHKEIVEPTLIFLSNPLFNKSDSDYRLAHKHYREGNVKDCIIACGRSFESMMKAICDDKGWQYGSKSRAGDLVTVIRANNLFQDGADKSFDTYVSMLKTGVPDLRNASGGHGEASHAPTPALHMAAYGLHLTGANLLFLASAWKNSQESTGPAI